MGYARYTVTRFGRTFEAGYAVPTICEEPRRETGTHRGCYEQIDRGLAYLCGQTPGGDEYGCGGYFCDSHLYPQGKGFALCRRCVIAFHEQRQEEGAML